MTPYCSLSGTWLSTGTCPCWTILSGSGILYKYLSYTPRSMQSYQQPLEMVGKSIGQRMTIRLRNKTTIEGKLVAYDEHLNLMIEGATIRKQDSNISRNLMYLRGDTVLLMGKPAEEQRE